MKNFKMDIDENSQININDSYLIETSKNDGDNLQSLFPPGFDSEVSNIEPITTRRDFQESVQI